MLQCSVLLLKQSSRGAQPALPQRALKQHSAALSALFSLCKASGDDPFTQGPCTVSALDPLQSLPMGGFLRTRLLAVSLLKATHVDRPIQGLAQGVQALRMQPKQAFRSQMNGRPEHMKW